MLSYPQLKNFLLELLFPITCLGCGVEGSYLCAECLKKIPHTPPSCIVCKKLSFRTCKNCRKETKIRVFFSPYRYDMPLVRELIHSLKYQRIRPLGAVFADLLALHLDRYNVRFPADACLLPIPLHSRRRRKRGFNQAALIASYLGARIGVEARRDILYKIKKTAPQVGLLRSKRLENVSDSFMVWNPNLIKGRTAILVDDVKTTGATLEEAAKVLKNAGAGKIWAITVAH